MQDLLPVFLLAAAWVGLLALTADLLLAQEQWAGGNLLPRVAAAATSIFWAGLLILAARSLVPWLHG